MSKDEGRSDLDGLVDAYLRELEQALVLVDPSDRAQLIQEIGEHIAELRSVQQVQSVSEMKNLLDRVGYPDDIAVAAIEDGNAGSQSTSRYSGRVTFAVVGLTVAIALALFLTLGSTKQRTPTANGHPAQTAARYTVPDLVGMSQAAAVTALEADGFSPPHTRNISSLSSPPGAVLIQSPPAGKRVEKGSKVSLSISSGPSGSGRTIGTVVMLNVFGQSQAQVGSELTSLGLDYTVHTVPSRSTPPGLVIATNPTAGSKVSSGSTISIVVSGGPPS